MKKLVIMVLLAAFAVGCTHSTIEEDYENNIKIVDKSKNVRPGNQGGGS